MRSCAPQRRDGARDRAHHARAARRRAVPAGHARHRQPAAPTTACARRFPRRQGRRIRAECVRRRAPRPHRRGRRARIRAADVPVAPVRLRVRRHGRSRARARRSTRVRSGRRRPRAHADAAAGRRLPLAYRPALRPKPGGSPPSASTGPQLLGTQRASTRCMLHAGNWRTADCYGAADALLVPFERARTHERAACRSARGGHARSASTAPRCRRSSASPGGLVVRVFRTDGRRGSGRVPTRGHAGARPRHRSARRAGGRLRRRPSTCARSRSAPCSSPSTPNRVRLRDEGHAVAPGAQAGAGRGPYRDAVAVIDHGVQHERRRLRRTGRSRPTTHRR